MIVCRDGAAVRRSESEKARSQLYSNRLRTTRSTDNTILSKAEWADLGSLQAKQDEESKCKTAISRQIRTEAYKKYFKQKPSDVANHDFAKWSGSVKYLGKTYYEVMGEERFEEDKLLDDDDRFPLKRSATASAPEILLFDSPSQPRTVTSVDVISTPNPSQEFIRRLMASLEESWGRKSSGNGPNEWRWNNKIFAATLKLEKAAGGMYLGLKIERR